MLNFINGFEPVIDGNSKILILGSFPSVKSREVGFYYGNPQNRFWKTICEFFSEEVPNSIDKKKEFLITHNIALYDAVGSCAIKGSSDSDINLNTAKPVLIDDVIKKAPNLKAVFCNGKKSYEIFTTFNKNINLPVFYLPSTSPANVSFKKEKWKDLLSKFF